MRVIVTGGAGFIGKHSVQALVNENHQVSVIDLAESGSSLDAIQTYYQQDILSSNALDHAFAQEKPEAVLHLAAQIDVAYSQKHPYEDAWTNINGTLRVLEMCKKHQVKHIVFSSSAAVYGNPQYLPIDEQHPLQPLSFYSLSKRTAEQYIDLFCAQNDMTYTILRYSNVYGPGQILKGECGVVAIFHHQLQKNLQQSLQPLIFGNGEQTRDFVYVKDVARANAAAIVSNKRSICNISTGSTITINKLYEQMTKHNVQSPAPKYVPARAGDIEHSCLDNHNAKKTLSWSPTVSVEQGIAALFSE